MIFTYVCVWLEYRVLEPTERERERGQRGPLQGGEAGGTLMLLSTVGYLQGEKASTVVTPCGSLEHT